MNNKEQIIDFISQSCLEFSNTGLSSSTAEARFIVSKLEEKGYVIIKKETNLKNITQEIQDSLDKNDDGYILKTDEQLIDTIINFGNGETEFHTADIERLIREKQELEKQLN